MDRAQRQAMWARRLAGWRQSGLALQPYCAIKRLSYSSMKRWRDCLGARADGAHGLADLTLRSSAVVPIEVSGAASLIGIATPPAIEIRLRSGRALVIEGEVDDARLARLITVVERAP